MGASHGISYCPGRGIRRAAWAHLLHPAPGGHALEQAGKWDRQALISAAMLQPGSDAGDVLDSLIRGLGSELRTRARQGRAWSFGALNVNDCRGRARCPALALARGDIERMKDGFQFAILIPQHEVRMRRALRRQVLRQRRGLSPTSIHIANKDI